MKRTRKIFVATLLISGLLYNPVFGATLETQEQTHAGVTPDSIVYTYDLFFEELRLAFASSAESEAKLLLEFAQERLSEAKVMSLEEKNEFVQQAMQDYLERYERAGELITEIVIEEGVDEETLNNLKNDLDQSGEINDQVEDYLSSKDEDLKEKIDNAYLVANVVKDLNKEQVIALRDNGMGYGQISQVFALSQYTGKSIEEIALLFTGKDVGFGEVSKLLGVSPSTLKRKTTEIKKENKESLVNTPLKDDTITEPVKDTVNSNNSQSIKKTVEKSTNRIKSELVEETRLNTAKTINNSEADSGLISVTKNVNEIEKDNAQSKENTNNQNKAQNKDKTPDKAQSDNKDKVQDKAQSDNKDKAQSNSKDKARDN